MEIRGGGAENLKEKRCWHKNEGKVKTRALKRIRWCGYPEGHPHQFRNRICRARSRREFCTSVHRFAQSCEQNLIDGESGNYYFACQIEPGSFRTLRINLEGATSLAVAPRDWIAKLEALTVSSGRRDGLTAVTPPGWFGKVWNFTVRFRGCSQLNGWLRREIGPWSVKLWRIGLEGATSLTAVAPPEGIEKVRNFTAQLEGATA